jgi:hypothetical protein
MNNLPNNCPTYMAVFRALLLVYDVVFGGVFVLLGVGGVIGALYDNPALAFDVGLVHLLAGFALLTAGVFLFAVRPPGCWTVGAISHGVTVLGLLASSWSMWRVVEIAVTRPPEYMQIIAHGTVETFVVWVFIGCAVLSLVATAILLFFASARITSDPAAEGGSPFK